MEIKHHHSNFEKRLTHKPLKLSWNLTNEYPCQSLYAITHKTPL